MSGRPGYSKRVYLERARKVSLELEAVLRSCELISSSQHGATIACPYRFHQNKLRTSQYVQQVFGNLEIYDSEEDFVRDKMKDPLVRFAVNELGAEIRRING